MEVGALAKTKGGKERRQGEKTREASQRSLMATVSGVVRNTDNLEPHEQSSCVMCAPREKCVCVRTMKYVQATRKNSETGKCAFGSSRKQHTRRATCGKGTLPFMCICEEAQSLCLSKDKAS